MAAGTTRSRRNRNPTAFEPQARNKARPLGAIGLSHRIVGVFVLVAALYLALLGRLAYLQVVQHAHYQKMAHQLRQRTRILAARRGVLLDRAGTPLVRNEPAANIVLDPNLWYVRVTHARTVGGRSPSDLPDHQRDRALAGLSRLLPHLDVAVLALKVSERLPGGRFRTVDVARNVDLALAQKVGAANLPGVGVLPTTRRAALHGSLAAHVVGFTDKDGTGLEGLEKGLEATLGGEPGLLEAEFDPRGRPIVGTVERDVPPRDGRDVLLTLDADLQHDVQGALQKAYDQYQAEAASALVLDAKTGEILALANLPTYDVNRRGDFPASSRTNRAITTPFEPGSTLKIITMAAALEEGKVVPDTWFHCTGARRIGKRTIHCAHGRRHGPQNALDVIRNSCNVATAECAFRLGKKTLWSYERRFGLGERTGCGLGGESRGLLAPPDTWPDIQLANVAFGQGIAVTTLQLAAAYAVIANDGVWMRPHIVWGTRPPDGAPIRRSAPEPGRRVVRASVARQLQSMLHAVVDNGTGKAAALDGYTAGGKTGTAQIAQNGSYRTGKYVASFAGMAPMHDPQFVIVVAVSAPKKVESGGAVAAPVFKEIAQKALLARRVGRDKSAPTNKRPEQRRASLTPHV